MAASAQSAPAIADAVVDFTAALSRDSENSDNARLMTVRFRSVDLHQYEAVFVFGEKAQNLTPSHQFAGGREDD